MNVARTFTALVSGVCLFWTVTAGAQGTAITYQGRLGSDAAPANGSYDFTFSVHDAVTGGSHVGAAVTNLASLVNNGLFVATLDFGPGVFNGAPRWLEIGVRTNGAEAFTVLSPRQPLTATPYALYAPTAGTALTAQSANTVATGSVGAAGLQNGAVDSLKIADDTITVSDLSSVLRNGTFWRLDGNAGTTAGTHFLGTTDLRALELKVNGQRALRLEPTTNSPNLIGGFAGNFVSNDVVGATVGGGGAEERGNRIVSFRTEYAPSTFYNAFPDYGTISGGVGNEIRAGKNNTVSGGTNNSIVGWTRLDGSQNNSIGGGANNRIAFGNNSTIAGGLFNMMNGDISFNVEYSTIGGGKSNMFHCASDPVFGATISGGMQNVIFQNSDHTTIGGGLRNFISWFSPNSTIAGGGGNNIYSFAGAGAIGGGVNNRVDNNCGVIAGGSWHRASGDNATIGGGSSNWVNAANGVIPGGADAMTHSYGQFAHASGQFANKGDAQTSVYVCRRITTTAAPTDLLPNGQSAYVNIPENSTWTFNILVTGRAANGDSAGYEIRGVLERNGNTTAFNGTPTVSVLSEDVTGWSANVTADDTNDALVVTATGAADTTIRWVASIRTVEVSF